MAAWTKRKRWWRATPVQSRKIGLLIGFGRSCKPISASILRAVTNEFSLPAAGLSGVLTAQKSKKKACQGPGRSAKGIFGRQMPSFRRSKKKFKKVKKKLVRA